MRSVDVRVLGLLLLLSGFITALLFRAVPPGSPLFWLLPALLFVSGSILIIYRWNLRWFLGVLMIIGLAMLVIRIPLWPADTNGDSGPRSESQQSLITTSLEVAEKFREGVLSESRQLKTLSGLTISVFAAGLDRPRMLAFSPVGDLYVSLSKAGKIVTLSDADHDGVTDQIKVFRSGLDRPHGMVFVDNDLYVAENGRLIKLVDRDRDLEAERIEVISTDLPAGGGHWTRSLELGADGFFYVSTGSTCNVCEEQDPRRAAVLRIAKSGGSAEIFASGLRNSVGIQRHPITGELWASNNGRDMLGDDLPPEEINRLVAGGDYGWPYCYGNRIPDPELGSQERCQKTIPPEVEMQAHSAPLGIAFGHGLNFPPPLQNMLFVAFHGSWNRSVPTGYKLIGIPFDNGKPAGPPQDIVSGWFQGHSAWGRPVAPAVGPDGALYLSDDRAGVIYRIAAQNRKT